MTRARTSSTRRRRITVKTRLTGGLVPLAVGAVLTTAALAASTTRSAKKASLKIGVSLAGYSTDFWSSYVAYEKQFTDVRTLITQGFQALILNRSTARRSLRRSTTRRASASRS
jgi:hypothetical protein